MAINLKILLKTAPLKEEDRTDFLNRFDTLSDDQKIRLSELCWKMISDMYHVKVKIASDQLMKDIALGTKVFNQADFEAIKQQALHEILAKFETRQTADQIEEVRQQLAAHQRLVGQSTTSIPQTPSATTGSVMIGKSG